jgi:hypothetical protein
VFTARYALSPYIKQIRFVFKGLKVYWLVYLSPFIGSLTTVSDTEDTVCTIYCVWAGLVWPVRRLGADGTTGV